MIEDNIQRYSYKISWLEALKSLCSPHSHTSNSTTHDSSLSTVKSKQCKNTGKRQQLVTKRLPLRILDTLFMQHSEVYEFEFKNDSGNHDGTSSASILNSSSSLNADELDPNNNNNNTKQAWQVFRTSSASGCFIHQTVSPSCEKSWRSIFYDDCFIGHTDSTNTTILAFDILTRNTFHSNHDYNDETVFQKGLDATLNVMSSMEQVSRYIQHATHTSNTTTHDSNQVDPKHDYSPHPHHPSIKYRVLQILPPCIQDLTSHQCFLLSAKFRSHHENHINKKVKSKQPSVSIRKVSPSDIYQLNNTIMSQQDDTTTERFIFSHIEDSLRDNVTAMTLSIVQTLESNMTKHHNLQVNGDLIDKKFDDISNQSKNPTIYTLTAIFCLDSNQQLWLTQLDNIQVMNHNNHTNIFSSEKILDKHDDDEIYNLRETGSNDENMITMNVANEEFTRTLEESLRRKDEDIHSLENELKDEKMKNEEAFKARRQAERQNQQISLQLTQVQRRLQNEIQTKEDVYTKEMIQLQSQLSASKAEVAKLQTILFKSSNNGNDPTISSNRQNHDHIVTDVVFLESQFIEKMNTLQRELDKSQASWGEEKRELMINYASSKQAEAIKHMDDKKELRSAIASLEENIILQKERYREVEKENIILKQKLASQSLEKERISQECTSLKDQLHMTKTHDKTTLQQSVKVSNVVDCEESQFKCKTLENKIDYLKAELSNEVSMTEELRIRLSQLQEEKESQANTNRLKIAELEQVKNDEIIMLSNKLRELKDTSSPEIIKLKEKINELKIKLEATTHELESCKRKEEQSRTSNQNEQACRLKLELELKGKEEYVNELQKELKQIKIVESDKRMYEASTRRLENEVNYLKNQLENEVSSKRNLLIKVESYEKQILELKTSTSQNIDQVSKQVQSEQVNYRITIMQLREKNEILEVELLDQKNHNKELDESFAKSRKDNRSLQQSLDKYKALSQTMSDELKAAQDELLNSKKTAEASSLRLEGTTKSMSETIRQIEKKYIKALHDSKEDTQKAHEEAYKAQEDVKQMLKRILKAKQEVAVTVLYMYGKTVLQRKMHSILSSWRIKLINERIQISTQAMISVAIDEAEDLFSKKEREIKVSMRDNNHQALIMQKEKHEKEIQKLTDYYSLKLKKIESDNEKKLQISLKAAHQKEKENNSSTDTIVDCENAWKKQFEEVNQYHREEINKLKDSHDHEMQLKLNECRNKLEYEKREIVQKLEKERDAAVEAAIHNQNSQLNIQLKAETKKFNRLLDDTKNTLRDNYNKQLEINRNELIKEWKEKLENMNQSSQKSIQQVQQDAKDQLEKIIKDRDIKLQEVKRQAENAKSEAIQKAQEKADETLKKIVDEQQRRHEKALRDEKDSITISLKHEMDNLVTQVVDRERATIDKLKEEIRVMQREYKSREDYYKEMMTLNKNEAEHELKRRIFEVEKLEAEKRENAITIMKEDFSIKLKEINSIHESETEKIKNESELRMKAHVKMIKSEAKNEMDVAVRSLTEDNMQKVQGFEHDMKTLKIQNSALESNLENLKNNVHILENCKKEMNDAFNKYRIQATFDKLYVISKALSRMDTTKKSLIETKDQEMKLALNDQKVKHDEAQLKLEQNFKLVQKQRDGLDDCMKMLSDTLLNYKRDELLKHKVKSRDVVIKLDAIEQRIKQIDKEKEVYILSLEKLEAGIRDIEFKLQEHSKVPTVRGGRIDIDHANKKRRLDEEYEQSLINIEKKRNEISSINEKSQSLREERNHINEEMRILERKLVEILVDQQKKLLSLCSGGVVKK